MTQYLSATVVEDDKPMSLAELARACRAAEEDVRVWVVEGVLSPMGESPQEWLFSGPSLRRARLAFTLTRDLELNTPGVALALDLMDEIESLRGRLRRG